MKPEEKSLRNDGRISPIGEMSEAFGDLGTFLPYVVSTVGVGLLAPAPVLLGFAAGYLMRSGRCDAIGYNVPTAMHYPDGVTSPSS